MIATHTARSAKKNFTVFAIQAHPKHTQSTPKVKSTPQAHPKHTPSTPQAHPRSRWTKKKNKLSLINIPTTQKRFPHTLTRAHTHTPSGPLFPIAAALKSSHSPISNNNSTVDVAAAAAVAAACAAAAAAAAAVAVPVPVAKCLWSVAAVAAAAAAAAAAAVAAAAAAVAAAVAAAAVAVASR